MLFVLFAGLLALAALRAADLGTLQASRLSAVAQNHQVVSGTVTPLRGAILDRNGDALALTEPGDDISAYEVSDPERAAVQLAPLIGESVSALAAKLTSQRGFQYLARQLPDARAQRIAALQITGVRLTTDNYRDYPFASLAGQVLGAVHLSGAGAGGIEQQLNRQLAGQNGQTSTVYAENGTPIAVNVTRQAVQGQDVRLTLDAALQQEAESVLAGVAKQYDPVGATAIAMNPQTGAVLALAIGDSRRRVWCGRGRTGRRG